VSGECRGTSDLGMKSRGTYKSANDRSSRGFLNPTGSLIWRLESTPLGGRERLLRGLPNKTEIGKRREREGPLLSPLLSQLWVGNSGFGPNKNKNLAFDSPRSE